MKKRCLITALFIALLVVGCGSKEAEVKNFHTTLQQQYLDDNYLNYAKYADGTEEKSRPQPINIEVKKATSIKLSLNEDLSDAKEYAVTDGKAEIYNLYSDTTYYYQVDKKVQSFKTAPGVRNLYIDGVTNVRDIGAYKTADGKSLKQGLLYRSAKFNADESTTAVITDNGLNTIHELGIKTEIDLRRTDNNENGGITSSPLGSSVTYYSQPMQSSGNIMTLNKDNLPAVFAILGNADNYPLVFHCSIGTDRTGYIAFLIEALCGLSEEDLYRDYLFSNFGLIYSIRTFSDVSNYLKGLRTSEGSDNSTKAYNYLVSCGVASTDLDNIKTLLINQN